MGSAVTVRLVCGRCALRYGAVVLPECRACAGTGLLAVVVPEGTDPWVAARAATLDGVKREAQIAAGLVVADVMSSQGLATGRGDTIDMATKAAIGREAGQLLRKMNLRQPPPPRPKPQRRSRAEVAAERAAAKANADKAKRRWAEMREQQRREDQEKAAAAATLAAYRSRHPEEFEQVYEAERTMVTIGDLPAVGVRGWCAG